MAANRKIFEEVEDSSAIRTSSASVAPKTARDHTRSIRLWLAALLACVIATVVVGGLTRLTDSGLSITEWNVVSGIMPPTNPDSWLTEFEKYKQIPEFKLQNPAMTLAEFQYIYWWEWGHRQLGRLVGLVWFIGFVWFASHKAMPSRQLKRIVGIGVLIGIQGVVGWWMVTSGLTGNVLDVTPYRLAIHLGLAFAVVGLVLWEIMILGRPGHELLQARRHREVRLEGWATAVIALTVIQVLAGALVAGNDAGQAFPSWPTMNGELLPNGSFEYRPILSNFAYNPALTVFNHRLLGYILLVGVLAAWWLSRTSARLRIRNWFAALLALTVGQVALGIVASIYAAAPPVAIIHQFGAVLLFCAAVRTRFVCRYPAMTIRK